MSTAVQTTEQKHILRDLPIDQNRGWYAMWCVIATESMLFVSMFGSYYFLGNNKDRWSEEMPPHLTYPFILLAILLSSSFVLKWGERQVKLSKFSTARLLVWVTVVMGIVFLLLQGFEYASHWKELAPYSDSYGSIFYALTTLHAAHVIAGLLMLCYVGVMPRYGVTAGSPHRIYETVALYWHFVDVVWILIVALLYVFPFFQGMAHGH